MRGSIPGGHQKCAIEYWSAFRRLLAEGPRTALYRAAGIRRATEPRPAGSRGSRPWRATIAAARKKDLGSNHAEHRYGLLPSQHGARPVKAKPCGRPLKKRPALTRPCAPCGRKAHGRDGEMRSRPNKKMDFGERVDRSLFHCLRWSSRRTSVACFLHTLCTCGARAGAAGVDHVLDRA